jgi:hypothetical protein
MMTFAGLPSIAGRFAICNLRFAIVQNRKPQQGAETATARDLANRKFIAVLLAWIFCGLCPFPLNAASNSKKYVFKIIQDNVGPKTDINSTPVVILALGGAAVLAVLVALSKREKKAAIPAVLNSAGKLNKEVIKQIALKPAEMKQLKMLAESIETEDGEALDPLTLLLCPSLLAKAVQANPPKLDRKAVALVVRKMRLGQQQP